MIPIDFWNYYGFADVCLPSKESTTIKYQIAGEENVFYQPLHHGQDKNNF